MNRFSPGIKTASVSIFPMYQNGMWGYNKNDGSTLLNPQFEEAHLLSYGLARVKKNGKYGFINEDGKLVIKCKYDEANDFKMPRPLPLSHFISKVKVQGKIKYINQNRKKVSHSKDEQLNHLLKIAQPIKVPSSIGKHVIQDGNKYELEFNYLVEDQDGNSVSFTDTTNFKIDTLFLINNVAIACKSNGKYGIVSKSQLNGIPLNKNPFHKHIFEKGNHELKINFIYDDLFILKTAQNQNTHFYFAAKKNNNWGIIDVRGKQFIPYVYRSIKSIEMQGHALVEYEQGKLGYVSINSSYDKNREIIYSYMEHFKR